MPRRARLSLATSLAALVLAGCGRPEVGGPTQPEEDPEAPPLEAVPYDALAGGTILFQRIAPGTSGAEIAGLYRVDGAARASEGFLPGQPLLVPALAPDGERFAFLAFTGGTTTASGFDLYVASLDGTGLRRLTSDDGTVEFPAAWSVDGTLTYALVGARTVGGRLASDIVRQASTAAPGDRQYLATLPPGGTSADSTCPSINPVDQTPVALAPQGTLAFVCNRARLYVLAPGGAPALVHVPGPPAPGGALAELSAPAWSPDGRRLAFIEIRRGTGADTTVVRRFDVAAPGAVPSGTATTVALVSKTPGQLFEWAGTHSLCWLPGGAALAFTAPESDRTAHVFVVAPAGGEPLRITTSATAFDRSVSCRP